MTRPNATSPPRGSAPRILLAALAVATVVMIVDASQLYLTLRLREQPISAARAIGFALPEWLLWAALAPAIFALARRFPLGRSTWRRHLPIHAGAAVSVALFHLLLTLAISWTLDPPVEAGMTFGAYYLRVLLRWFHVLLLVYAAIVGVAHAIEFSRKARARELEASRLEARLAEARLAALRAQLQPHFLFNTLNSVASLVRKGDAAEAVRTLAGLSDVLRLALDGSNEAEVPLAREVAFAERYLAIEQIRFADRLRIEVDLPLDARDALVPNLLLQPIVENAVRHGVARRPGSGRIAITAKREGDRLAIRVRDDGPGPGESRELGVGLGNTIERLRRLYGEGQRLVLQEAEGGGAEVRVEIPYRRAPRGEEETIHA